MRIVHWTEEKKHQPKRTLITTHAHTLTHTSTYHIPIHGAHTCLCSLLMCDAFTILLFTVEVNVGVRLSSVYTHAYLRYEFDFWICEEYKKNEMNEASWNSVTEPNFHICSHADELTTMPKKKHRWTRDEELLLIHFAQIVQHFRFLKIDLPLCVYSSMWTRNVSQSQICCSNRCLSF